MDIKQEQNLFISCENRKIEKIELTTVFDIEIEILSWFFIEEKYFLEYLNMKFGDPNLKSQRVMANSLPCATLISGDDSVNQ